MSAAEKLRELDINLPDAPPPAANYAPYVIEGNLVTVSGQVCFKDGDIAFTGRVGQDLSLEQGKQAARLCALNVLTQLREACGGDFTKVKRCVRLGVFVNAPDFFTEHPEVANGASDLIMEVFGDAGKHARAAVGCASLPRNTAVEVEAVFALHPQA